MGSIAAIKVNEVSLELAVIDDALKAYNEGFDKWTNSKKNLIGKASIEMGVAISKLNGSIILYQNFITKAKEIGADTKQAESQLVNAKQVLALANTAKSKLDSI